MIVNTDINILGSILDLTIINNVFSADQNKTFGKSIVKPVSNLKTTRSVERYERAVKNTLLLFKNIELNDLFYSVFKKEELSQNALTLLFLNASFNNDLLNYFNLNIYFPAYYSGRIGIRKNEIIACIHELKQKEENVKLWSDSTIDVVARKYLALLEKFSLLEGARTKLIQHNYVDDIQLMLFIYWICKTETKANILESNWFSYSFLEKDSFIERILQKKFMKYINVIYTGDSVKIETRISYKEIFNELTKF